MTLRVVFSLAVALALVSPLHADVVLGSGNWYSWNTSMLKGNGGSGAGFWDNSSLDGAKCNVGYWITGTQSANCGNVAAGSTGGPGALSFYGGNTRNRSQTFQFSSQPGYSNGITLKAELAGNRNFNQFGYFDDTVAAGSSAGVLFTGAEAPSATEKSFTAVGNFGFWVKTKDNTLLTSTSGNNFVLFSEVPVNPSAGSNLFSYWIGAEDMRIGDGDFQDLLVRIEAVPEPHLIILLSSSLLVTFVFGWRRFRRSSAQ